MKILVALLIIIVLYFAFLHNNKFEKSFSFAGNYYSYNRTQGGGSFKNHFYTLGDSDPLGNNQVVQIVEFPEELLPEPYEYYMKPLYTRYKLEPYGQDPLERVGSFEQAGLKFKSYSNKIEIEGKTHMVFYPTTLE